VAIEEDLRDSREVSFQAALLYTSSKGERRIRVHTLCLPTTANLNDVINGADEAAVIGMLTKFGNSTLRTSHLTLVPANRVVSSSLALGSSEITWH
jgi:protein transport protein SEC24